MRVRVADRVQVVRGEFQGTVGVVQDTGTKFLVIRAAGADGWPFGQLVTVDRHDLLVIDRNEDVEEALL